MRDQYQEFHHHMLTLQEQEEYEKWLDEVAAKTQLNTPEPTPAMGLNKEQHNGKRR